MKIVIALDSFKGSCSAQAACAAVAQGLRRVDQTLELVEMPVSDGGEGLLSTLADSPLLKGAVWQQQRCTSPYGLSVQADFLILPGERAIIEMAQSCGLELTPPAQRDVRQASSYGLGEQVKGGAGRRVSALDYRPGRQRDQRWRHRFCPGARRTILA